MSGPLEELERLSSEARSKKGRMDADSRKQAAALLQLIWTDAAQDPRAALPYLPELKAEALADAIAQSWSKMDSERKALFEQWLPPPATERDIRRLAFLVGSLIEADPSTAIRWLIRLAPPGRKTPTKETRQHLAAGLLDTTLGFHGLASTTLDAGEILRLYTLLWGIATDPSFAVPMMSRIRLAKAVFAFDKTDDGSAIRPALEQLKSQIRVESASWPAPLRNEFDPHGEQIERERPSQDSALIPDGDAGTIVGAAERSELAPAGPLSVELCPDAAGSGNVRGGTDDPLRESESKESAKTPAGHDLAVRIDERIAHIPLELDLLRSLQVLLKQQAGERQAHKLREEQLAETKAALGDTRSALDAANRERDLSREEARREKARADGLEAKLTQFAQDTEDERRRLGQQISANASGRIEEFKNRLGSSLSRLVKDLPAARTDVSPELGKVLLLQFHQFLEALRQEGVSVRVGAES